MSQPWPLICPHCAAELVVHKRPDGRPYVLACEEGHQFDAAKQGHVNMLTGKGTKFLEDSAEMVASRERWLEADHYLPLGRSLASAAMDFAPAGPVTIVDTGAGTGWYSRVVLDAFAAAGREARAIDIDLSKSAAQRAARDERVLSLVGDTWKPWPVAGASVQVILDVFAPRNVDEFKRVLSPGGIALVVTPAADHLAGLSGRAGMLAIDAKKEDRLAEAFADGWESLATVHNEWPLPLTAESAVDLAHMGPAGHHQTHAQMLAELAADPLPETRASVVVHAYRRLPTAVSQSTLRKADRLDHPRG